MNTNSCIFTTRALLLPTIYHDTMKHILSIFALTLAALTIIPEGYAQLRKANRALDRGNYNEATSLAEELIKKDSTNHKAWDLSARIHREQAAQSTGKAYLLHIKDMVAAYDKVVESRSKEEYKVMLQKTQIYLQEFARGIEEFNNGQIIADDDSLRAYHLQNSALHFQASSIVSPDSIGSYVNWAYALMGAGKSEEAIEPLALALKYGDPDPELYDYLARIYLTNDRAMDAVALLEEAVIHFPDSSEFQDYLLSAYNDTDQNDRALEKYQQAVHNDPDNEIYRYNYGSLLLQSERYDEAIEQLKEAIMLDEGYVDAHYNLGAAYINKANAVQDKISKWDDDMRENRDVLSEEEKDNIMEQTDSLAQERKDLYQKSIEPLEVAKVYGEKDEGRSLTQICGALYQAYAQTGQEEKALSVNSCAGYDEAVSEDDEHTDPPH